MSASRLVRPALAAARRTAPGTAIRSYATPAVPTNTKPPVELFGVDGTYASALVCKLQLCEGKGRTVSWLKDSIKEQLQTRQP